MNQANEVFTKRVLALIDSHRDELVADLPVELIKPKPPYTSCYLGRVSTGPISMWVTGHADS